ncbi:MAG TPA: M56 family metallopeptidase, partial [Gemmataceae bacterium]|nr:M56 family metallopeptidase [Gemmataceae bacterium]
MSHLHAGFDVWLLQSLAVGGAILLLACLSFLIVRQPAQRRQVGAWAVRIALLAPFLGLMPSWILLPRPVDERAPPVAARNDVVAAQAPAEEPVALPQPQAALPDYYVAREIPAAEMPAVVAPPIEKDAPRAPVFEPDAPAKARSIEIPWRSIAIGGYLALAGLFLLRFCLGHLAIWRMLRRTRLAPDNLTALLATQLSASQPPPRLLISKDLPAPVCCGLLRPTIVLPECLSASASDQTLTWVFAHELAHIQRGDLWTSFWLALAQIVYFPFPWLWWLRGQIALAQEFVADANAVGSANRADDYANFLLELSGRLTARRTRLAITTGVLGKPSDLYRRIAMLLNNSHHVERRYPRSWATLAAGAFLAVALVLSGIGWQRGVLAAPDDPKDLKDTPKDQKDTPKKAEPPKKEETPKLPAEPEDPFDKMFEQQ